MLALVATLPAASVGAQQIDEKELNRRGIRTVQDALEQMKRRQANDRSAPAQPLGNPGQFFGPDSYPPTALRAGEQGRSVVRVEIDARGFPGACSVVTSSGSAVLDETTCSTATTRLQYSPAKDQNGRPIASQYTLSVKWVLPPPSPPPAVDLSNGRVQVADTIVQFEVDEGGLAMACKVVLKPASFPDPCGGFKPGVAPYPAARIDGRPSRSVVTVETTVMSDRPDP